MQARRSHVVTLIAGIAIGVLVFGTAEAVTSTSFTYSKAKIGYYSMSATDFAPDRLDGATLDYRNDAASYLTNDDNNRFFFTGVYLPNGAKILSVTFWYASNASGDFRGELDRIRQSDGGYQQMAVALPADDSSVRKAVTLSILPTMQTVSNGTYSYSAYVGVPQGTPFYGARIKYSYTSAGA
jgi:hypothetical protein